MVRRETDFSHLHRAIFNRPVFWSAVCRGCVIGNIQSHKGLYCDVIFLGDAGCQIFTSQPVFLAPTICKFNSSLCRRDKSSPRHFVARSFVFLKDEHKRTTWGKSNLAPTQSTTGLSVERAIYYLIKGNDTFPFPLLVLRKAFKLKR